MNYKHGTFRRVKRDPQSGPDSSTVVSITYVTSAPTLTGPIVGYMTLGPALDINSGDKVATPLNSVSSTDLSTSSQSILSTSRDVETPIAATSTTTATSTFTSTSFSTSYSTSITSETSTSVISSSSLTSSSVTLSSTSIPTAETPSSTSVAEEVVEASSTPIRAAVTSIPAAMAMTTPAPSATSSIVTSLKDLPLVIESPTSIAPKSMSLLVATSSSAPLIPHSSTSIYEQMPTSPIAPTASSPSDTDSPQESSSMGTTGKASLIIGVVLLLGAIFMLLQVYLNKRRRSLAGEKIGDDEKGGLPVMKSRSAAPTPIPPLKDSATLNKNVSNSNGTSNSQSEKTETIRPASPLVNPFGKNAEILVDPINANGAKVMEKVNNIEAHTPVKRLDRVASIQGPKPLDHGRTNLAAAPPSPATAESTTAPANLSLPNGPVNMALPNGMVNAVYRVLMDFLPSMDDELELRAGQLIRVLHEYDDGWAMCIRLDCSKQGVCPRTCLSPRPVKPRSPSGGPRGPPPSINVPMTPTGRPQSHPRTPRGSPPYIGPGTPGRKPSLGQELGTNHQGQQPSANGPHSPSGHVNLQRNAGHPGNTNAEVPLPLALFPRGLPGAIQSQEGAPVRVGTVPCGTPSTNPGAHSITTHQTGYNATVTPSSACISLSPECPGPMTPSSDYFSLNKPTPDLPSARESAETMKKTPTCKDEVSDDTNALPDSIGGKRNQSTFPPLDLENERSVVPGQAL